MTDERCSCTCHNGPGYPCSIEGGCWENHATAPADDVAEAQKKAYDPEAVRIDVADSLTTIVELYEQLAGEAYSHPNDRDLPGGDALHYAGPIAHPADWQRRYDLSDPKTQDWMVENSVKSDHHPLLVLATAEDDIRAMLDQPTDLTTSVWRAADYIRAHIDDIVPEGAWKPIGEFTRQLKASIGALENVLHAGHRPTKGAPCVHCNKPLKRHWKGNRKNPKTKYDDTWTCKACDITYTHAQYLNAVRADFLATSDRLTAADMQLQYDIKPGTLRRWVHDGYVERRGKDDYGRQLYDVDQAVKRRDRLITATQPEPDQVGA